MSIAFIVDGVSEKKIIQRLCGDATVRITQLNGRDVTLSAIVDKVESFIRLFKDRFSPVYVVVDRESRDIASEDMEQQLREMLAAKNIDVGGIVFCCPDRMIENWIIAGTVQMDG
ncbi:hypothetical protein LOK46_27510 [Methylobacterium sp. NMS14P]|uniref:hypothetical protein n=1 Tax=Methylobacterium sp. NMS14P TaxID=2894310 RepID=UPI002358F5F9|nr:hypothetical protein [Methylobacterium sp. NMS14P]WCS24831.1 hypothetical protein LOK46_27510 [Methylobacterium sp. NMS14P]